MSFQQLRNPKCATEQNSDTLEDDLSSQRPTDAVKEAIVQGAVGGRYAIIVTDHTKLSEPVAYVNHAFEELTGYKLAEVIGIHPHFLLTSDREQAGVKELEAAFRAGRACTAVLRDYRKNDGPIWYQVTITPIFGKNERVTHFFGYLTDVTERVESEAAEEDMETFIASLAHDLKTPLIGADRMFALIRDGEYGPLVPELQHTMMLLSKGNKKALDLVRNLIESYRSRKNTGLLHFEIIDVPALILSSVQEIESTLEPNEAEFVVTINENIPACIFDRLAISRVIANLLDNAVKFSHKGGKIQVSAERINEQILLKVADNGIGVHPEDRDEIFKKCKRNRIQKHTPGCGLGLYICKEIVKAHRGRISLETELAVGTTISVLLPISANKNADKPQSGA